MTQDNELTVEKIRKWMQQEDSLPESMGGISEMSQACLCIDFLLEQVESLKLSLSGKTNFDEVAELNRQVGSQDEITAALHIVNAELGRRVESQKEDINDCIRVMTSALVDEDCGLHGRAFGKIAKKRDAIRTKYSLPKEE